jgi:hypothetical protein
MNRLIVSGSLSRAFFCLITAASAATLKVGPNQQFAQPSPAWWS